MLSKYSVKKPYTVLVAVVLIIVLGCISFTSMTTDLLPNMEFPYIIVMTTYPGASPEKVESSVTRPLESSLGSISGLKNISSSSSENVSMITLEFMQSTNMDSAMIEVSNSIDLAAGSFDDMVGTPMFLKISPDLLPVMVASLDLGTEMPADEIADFVNETVIPRLERIDGVASVSATGLSDLELQLNLDPELIGALNEKVKEQLDETLDEAYNQLLSAKNALASAQSRLDNAAQGALEQLQGSGESGGEVTDYSSAVAERSALASERASLQAERFGLELSARLEPEFAAFKTAFFTQYNLDNNTAYADFSDIESDEAWTEGVRPALLIFFAEPENEGYRSFVLLSTRSLEQAVEYEANLHANSDRVAEIDARLSEIDARIAVIDTELPQQESSFEQVQEQLSQFSQGAVSATSQLAKAQAQILISQQQIEEGLAQFEASRESAYEQADLTNIITEEMISGILNAENFSMPAGYIEDETGRYLVKVGDVYKSMDEVASTILFTTEATGDIRISDIAQVSLVSVDDGSYAKVNGVTGVVLSFQKQSTASTAEVAHSINDTIEELEAEHEGLRITPLMDQGDYIDLIVGSVLQNLVVGGILAVLILLLFLRDAKPTLVIAFSIPISLMFAVTLMYFTGVTLNIISLSGLALGVGMLVDNSIVVIENIYRMRNEGVPSREAAVEGAKQVAAAVFASTLTTVCVFLPIVFTQGISRQLFTDMGLTIAYSLSASLIVALTLVPAMSATLLRHTSEKEHSFFDRVVDKYEVLLSWSLDHRGAVLGGAGALLALAIFGAAVMGTAFIPEMDSEQMSATLSLGPDDKEVDLFTLADEVADRILSIEEVEYVGAMSGGSSLSMSAGSDSVSFYFLLSEDRDRSNKDVQRDIVELTSDLPGELTVEASTMNMSMLAGSGVQVVLKCNDLDTLVDESERLAAMLREVEGVAEVTTGYENADTELRVTVNKDEAMRKGLTVAQVYAELASALTVQTQSTTVTTTDKDYQIVISDHGAERLTTDGLGDYEFTVQSILGEEVTVRLSDIAEISMEDSISAVQRDNQARYNSVTATIADGYNIGLVSRELDAVLEGYVPPEGCTMELEGENETIQSALSDLVMMILLAVVFIYLIMVAQFQSLLSPFIVLFTLPLAFTGGLLLLWVTGKELSVIAMLGFLVLAGVVVNNGIVFVDYANQLRDEQRLDTRDALIQTGRTRIRPILMTAMTTILAMSTMALGIGSGAEMTQPMAIVTIGGLTYATLLTLIVVPVMYSLLHSKRNSQVLTEGNLE